MAQILTPADWIAVDWGTSTLRLWAMRGGEVAASVQSDKGMGGLAPNAFAGVLREQMAVWQVDTTTPIIACGMVGARQGWVEAPYRAVPCTPLGGSFATVPEDDLNVSIIAGLRQDGPADVMRGEETQIAGFLALNPNWDGVICLPGTHTKWAHISAGEVVSFQTYLTGELFALLGGQSVLRHSVQGEGWDDDAFAKAISDAMSRPERLAALLFSIRAQDLLQGVAPAAARARLSGLLIGAELAAARPYWLGQNVAIIGAAAQADLYASALTAQGVPATRTDADRMTLAGLTSAYRQGRAT